MKLKQLGTSGCVIRVEKWEEAMDALRRFIRKRKIKSCWFTGLGATEDLEVAWYNPKTKGYEPKRFQEPLEVTNITGNGEWCEGKPWVHAHITVSDRRGKAWGGHVNRVVAYPTLELHLQAFRVNLVRKVEAETRIRMLEI